MTTIERTPGVQEVVRMPGGPRPVDPAAGRRKRPLGRLAWTLVGLCVASSAAASWFYWEHHAGAETGQQIEYLDVIQRAAPPAKAAAPKAIGKQPVEVVQRALTLRLTGSLAADEKSEVGSNAAGIVSETRVNRGSIVKKDDLLVQLDPRDAQYALIGGQMAAEELRVRLGLDEAKEFDAQAKEFDTAAVPEVEAAKLAKELAEKKYKRSESLKQQNMISAEAADQMEAEYRSAIQQHRLAILQAKQLYQGYQLALARNLVLKKAVDDCSIRAPFDGWVAERNISVGERVIALFPGAKLVTLLRIDPLRLTLTVPQQESAQIKVGQKVVFQTDAFPGETFTGAVRYITPQVTSDSRSLCVEAVAPNPDGRLRPGLFVSSELQLDRKRTELYVPQSAVSKRGEVGALFVVRQGVIREQIVSLGETVDGRVRIASGLAPGDVVITTPALVHDGDAG